MTNALRVRREPEDDSPPDNPDLVDVAATEVKCEKVSWLWPDRLGWGTVAIMQGAKGVGKSTWLRTIAADVTGGPRIPGTRGKRRVAGSVLWYAGEESLKRKVCPGLKEAGAVLSRCFVSDCYAEEASDQLALPGDCDRLQKRIELRKAKLVIIDPIFSFSDGTCDLDGPTVPARNFMRRIAKVAAATDALIIFSRNLVKSRKVDAIDAGRGGGEMGNAARSVLHVQRLPNELAACALSVAACNDGEPVPSVHYVLEKGPGGYPVVRVTGQSGITADELVAGEEGELERHMIERAKALIKTLLPRGKLDSKIIKAKAMESMIETRTLQSAAQALGVQWSRTGSRETTVCFWSPPKKGWDK